MGALAATTMIFVQAGISLCLLGFVAAGVKPDLNATKIVSDKDTAPKLVSDKDTAPKLVSDKDTAPKIVSDKDIAPKKLIEGSAGVAAQLFETHGVVPDVIDKAPPAIAKIVYPNGVTVDIGKELTPTQVKDQPTVTWDAEDGAFYTLCMTDPDAPSRKEPKLREWQHWLVGNIPEKDVSKGEVLSAYIGSGPPPNTGLHRYVYLIYKQPGQLKFDEKRLTNTSAENREKFSTKSFAAKYKLGDPIAGNLYLAQYDDYVPILYKQLGE